MFIMQIDFYLEIIKKEIALCANLTEKMLRSLQESFFVEFIISVRLNFERRTLLHPK